MNNEFPKNFLWGASTSAYQVEGAAHSHGKGLSQQDIINKDLSEKLNIADASITSDMYHHYKEDVKLFKELGLKSYRFSISWSRIFPKGRGEANQEGVDFYHNLIDDLRNNGIEPIVTMYHYDLPWALVKEYGGWLSRKVVKDFTDYAKFIINEYKDDVKYWTTINEQSIIVQYWTQKCYIPPKFRDNDQLRYQINHYMNLCHAIACNLVHELVPGGKVGSAIGYSAIYPLSSKPEDVMAAQNANDLRNYYYLDIYFKGYYDKAAFKYLENNNLAPKIKSGDMDLIASASSDFLALNNYASECAKACPASAKRRWSGVNWSGKKGQIDGFETQPGFYQMCENPNVKTNDWDWAIDPVGLEYILRDIYERYNKPLMITENGLGARDKLTLDHKIHDQYRIDYLGKNIKAIKKAIDYGVPVISYNVWSALDLLSTSNGYKKRYGLIYVDRTDKDPKKCKRIKKDSFNWYQKVIQTNGKSL